MSRSIRVFYWKWPEIAKWDSPHRWKRFLEVCFSGIQRERNCSLPGRDCMPYVKSARIYRYQTSIGHSRIEVISIDKVDSVTFQTISTCSWADIRFQNRHMFLTKELIIIFHLFVDCNQDVASTDSLNREIFHCPSRFLFAFFRNFILRCYLNPGFEALWKTTIHYCFKISRVSQISCSNSE
jgi:hypothetical protein